MQPRWHRSVEILHHSKKKFRLQLFSFWPQTESFLSDPCMRNLYSSENISVFQKSSVWFSYMLAKSRRFLWVCTYFQLLLEQHGRYIVRLSMHSSLHFQKLDIFLKARQFYLEHSFYGLSLIIMIISHTSSPERRLRLPLLCVDLFVSSALNLVE